MLVKENSPPMDYFGSEYSNIFGPSKIPKYIIMNSHNIYK
jgi:hypothetical protein